MYKDRLHTSIKVPDFKDSLFIGRANERKDIIKLISYEGSQQLEVISICGMGGLGKTALVKDVYQSQELIDIFEKHACVTIKHPFDPKELINSLTIQLHEKYHEDGAMTNLTHGKTKLKDPPMADLLKGKRYMIVLDDLSFTAEWDLVVQEFPVTGVASRIVITTRDESIAMHCTKNKKENIYKLKSMDNMDAQDLFMEKVSLTHFL